MTATLLDTPLSLGDSALRPDDTVESSYRHLHVRRRLRLGPAVTVVFEDRHTLWFRIQELIRYAQFAPEPAVRRQFDWYQRLIPGGGRLVAAVWASRRDPHADEVGEAVERGRLVLRSDAGHEVVGSYLDERASDRLLGSVLWAEFQFGEAEKSALHEPFVGWELSLEAVGYPCRPVRLPESMIDSLSADVD